MKRPRFTFRRLRPPIRFEGSVGARVQYSMHALGSALPGGPRSLAIKLLSLSARPFFDPRNAVILDLGFPFRVELNDPLWTRLLYSAYTYEPEIEFILTKALDERTVFIDGGANKGYWTNFVLSRPHRKVIAIEAASETFERLTANVRLTDARPLLLQAALFETSGARLSLVADRQRPGRSHLSKSGLGGEPGSAVVGRHQRLETVGTVTLDEIFHKYLQAGDRVIVKLDIEGAETSALRGGRRSLATLEPLVLYEDHGRDPEASASRFVIEELGLAVFYCEAGVLRHLAGLAEVKLAKGANPLLGTDFFACSQSSQFFALLKELEGSSVDSRAVSRSVKSRGSAPGKHS